MQRLPSYSTLGARERTEAMQRRLDRKPDAMTIRRSTVEHVFGTLKHWMGPAHFLTRTPGRVSTEKSLQVLAYNLKRVMNILGVRSYQQGVREQLIAGVRRTADAEAQMSGAFKPDVLIEPGGEAVINDANLVARTETVLRSAYGKDVIHIPPATASEDFSDFVNAGVPSMFFFIGVYDKQQYLASLKPGGTPLPSNHSPFFAPLPEPSIKTGVVAMTLAVYDVLARPKSN